MEAFVFKSILRLMNEGGGPPDNENFLSNLNCPGSLLVHVFQSRQSPGQGFACLVKSFEWSLGTRSEYFIAATSCA